MLLVSLVTAILITVKLESQPGFDLHFLNGLLRLGIRYVFIAVCISDLFCVHVFVNATVPEDKVGIQFFSCHLIDIYQSVVKPGYKHLYLLSYPHWSLLFENYLLISLAH